MNEDKKVRPEKQAIVEEVRGQLENALFVILTDYKGMNVTAAADLRERLRPAGAEFHVVKNSYLTHASRGLHCEGLEKDLSGPTAMVCGTGDVVETAKVIRSFIKENDIPVIKVGSMQGVILSPDEVDQLATIPSRMELLATAVGTIAAPMSGMVGVLNQKLSSLLYVLQAIEEKKQSA